MLAQLLQGDCLDVMRGLPDRSVDLIATDPPYFKVKDAAWDHQWEDAAAFLAWVDLLAEQWARILQPNGSLYVFAAPRMAARVEAVLAARFAILNCITWEKEQGRHKAAHKEGLRCFFPASERIIFAEHYGADNMAKGEGGYAAKCDELRGFVFEPLRSYLAAERDRAGFTSGSVDLAFRRKTGNPKSGMAGHWFGRSQWVLPTRENY
jgi:adenine-specific DNA-methyltransferase